MWVLEARKDAEKVWFPVVWEEKKGASNIIDYDIHEEITIDASSVFNANNDTTTGMATVIPWVNAPMLLEKTSIYANSEWLMWGITVSKSISLYYPNDNRWYIRNWNLSDKYWNINFRNRVWDTVWEWLIIPTSWWYDISMVCPPWSSVHSIDVDLRITRGWMWNDVTLINHTWWYNPSQPTETLRYNFTAWDTLYAYLVLNYTWWWQMSATPTVTFTITKL
jgi:hypothetical protein